MTERDDLDPCPERALLGAILLDSSHGRDEAAFERASTLVRAEDFSDPRHAVIFEALGTLHRLQSSLDVGTVCAELRRMRRLNAVGGAQYVGSLTDEIPSPTLVEVFASQVHDEAQRRRVAALATSLPEIARSAQSPDEAIARVRSALDEIEHGTLGSIDDTLSSVAPTMLDDVLNRTCATLRPLGSVKLDGDGVESGALGGLAGGDVLVIAADNGGGKTALAIQAARAVAERGESVMIFSYELQPRRILHRLAAHHCGVGEQEVRSGRLTDDALSGYAMAVDRSSRLPIRVRTRGTVEEVCAAIRAAAIRLRPRLGLVVVDYLQLIEPTPGVDRGKTHERIERHSRALKAAAMAADVGLILLSQLNRTGNKAEAPTLHDLRGSGAIESDADVVLLLHAPDPDSLERRAIVAKNRSGTLSTVGLWWDGPHQLLRDDPSDVRVPNHLIGTAAASRAAIFDDDDFGPSIGDAE